MRILLVLAFSGLVGISAYGNAQDYVVEDKGVGLSREELEYIVKFWTPDMQEAAANDAGDRIELLNLALSNKKIAAGADQLAEDMDPDAYWKMVLTVRNIKSKFVLNNFVDNLDIPDMSALAAERYQTQKDKYALVPEQRLSSHILLLCPAGSCNRDGRRLEAQEILAELQAGANFEELAGKYSEDPGSKNKGGKFAQWLTMGQTGAEPHYVGGVFEIENVGDYSGLVDSKFGVHIIRLDDIKPAHYKSYEEVKEQIVADLRNEYIKLAAKEFDADFRLGDDVYIDGAALDEIFAPYKSTDISSQ
jgi:hypothetical protein